MTGGDLVVNSPESAFSAGHLS